MGVMFNRAEFRPRSRHSKPRRSIRRELVRRVLAVRRNRRARDPVADQHHPGGPTGDGERTGIPADGGTVPS